MVTKIIHLTDIHLTSPGKTIGGRDPNKNFERALYEILKYHSNATLMVITGDLSDWGDAPDYQRLREHLADFPIPTRLCIGNHDDRAVFLRTFPDTADDSGFVQGIYETEAARCIMLDTWGPETHAGHYCAQRCAWLDARLSEHDGPHLLFMHHNPIPTHIGPMDQIGLMDAKAFATVAAKHKDKIRHIFFGHCHLPLSGSVANIAVTGIRGTNHAGYPNFGEKELLSASDLPESYGVIFVSSNTVTVHMVEYGYSGDIRIEGSPDYAAWDRERYCQLV
ncbi:MAG: phosphodiesterase [Pseudomonadota bacterium]